MNYGRHFSRALIPIVAVMLSAVSHGQVTSLSAGIISTIAGNGTAGSSGNGGTALNAELNNPSGVAVDPNSGAIYISDSVNGVIRKIDPVTRNISVYAGGTPIVNTPNICYYDQYGQPFYGGPLLVGDGGPAYASGQRHG